MGRRKKRNYCPKCGAAAKIGDQFCSGCKHSEPCKKSAKQNRNWIWIVTTVAAVSLLGTFAATGIRSNNEKAVYQVQNTAQIQSIVSAFGCSFGLCDKALKDCYCSTAEEMNKYIAGAVSKETYSRKEVIKMVNDRYGHLIDQNELQS